MTSTSGWATAPPSYAPPHQKRSCFYFTACSTGCIFGPNAIAVLRLPTTQDEAGTAVYKTIELDTYLKDVPVQHREVQGHESPLFLSYFPNGVRILEGGVASGFQHVSPTEYKVRPSARCLSSVYLFFIFFNKGLTFFTTNQPRLLQLKGRRTVRAQQVPLSRDSLNSGDVFILGALRRPCFLHRSSCSLLTLVLMLMVIGGGCHPDNGLVLYQWNGSKSSGQERIKAAQLCRAIDDEREGKPRVVVMGTHSLYRHKA